MQQWYLSNKYSNALIKSKSSDKQMRRNSSIHFHVFVRHMGGLWIFNYPYMCCHLSGRVVLVCLSVLFLDLAFSLTAAPSTSRPKIVFLYFLFVKRVWYTCIENTLFIFQFFIFALLQAKDQFCPQRGFRRWSKSEIHGFWEARYGQLNTA